MIAYNKYNDPGRSVFWIRIGNLLLQFKIVEPGKGLFSERSGYYKGFAVGKFQFEYS